MKFAHIADCHIGGWRDPKMQRLNTKAFLRAVEIIRQEEVDFIVIAGDLFNTALPGIDQLREVVREFRKLKKIGVPIYLIAGSHDFSPSQKSMLDVLEEAGLCINVTKGSVEDGKLRLKFTADSSGAKLTGLLGRRGMLEKNYYHDLDHGHLEQEGGFKIFLFHTALDELKPKNMQRMISSPVSMLPKGFDYYAGGHVHIVEDKTLPGYKHIVYPGPLFPNSFHELWELKGGGFFIYDDGDLIRKEISLHPIICREFDASGKVPESITAQLMAWADETVMKDAIVLLRLHGKMSQGKISEIGFLQLTKQCYDNGAYFVMRNTSRLNTKEFEATKIAAQETPLLEQELISEHVGQVEVDKFADESRIILKLMSVLSSEKDEGEKVYEFEERIQQQAKQILRSGDSPESSH